MASLTEEIADALARDALRAAEELGDDNLITEVSRVIGASSATTQEAFMTFVRVRLSEQRARRLIADKVGADWPLPLATPGAVAVQVMGTVPAVAAPPASGPAPVEPQAPEAHPISAAPEQAAVIRPAPAQPAPVQPAPAQPAPAQPAPVQVARAVEVPIHEEPTSEARGVREADRAEEASVGAEAPPASAPVIRPRVPTPAPKPVAPPVTRSFEAALMLATSLPRKPLPQPERTYSADPLEPGLEVPDGDWG